MIARDDLQSLAPTRLHPRDCEHDSGQLPDLGVGMLRERLDVIDVSRRNSPLAQEQMEHFLRGTFAIALARVPLSAHACDVAKRW